MGTVMKDMPEGAACSYSSKSRVSALSTTDSNGISGAAVSCPFVQFDARLKVMVQTTHLVVCLMDSVDDDASLKSRGSLILPLSCIRSVECAQPLCMVVSIPATQKLATFSSASCSVEEIVGLCNYPFWMSDDVSDTTTAEDTDINKTEDFSAESLTGFLRWVLGISAENEDDELYVRGEEPSVYLCVACSTKSQRDCLSLITKSMKLYSGSDPPATANSTDDVENSEVTNTLQFQRLASLPWAQTPSLRDQIGAHNADVFSDRGVDAEALVELKRQVQLLEEQNQVLKNDRSELTLQLLESASSSGLLVGSVDNSSSNDDDDEGTVRKLTTVQEDSSNSAFLEAKQEIMRLQQQVKDIQLKSEETNQVLS